MLLSRLVESSETAAATRSRTAKVTALSEALAEATDDELSTAVAFLSGDTPTGRIGVGWATLAALQVPPAGEPTVTLAETAHTFRQIETSVGAGSNSTRTDLLGRLFARATAAEAQFLRRLLVGELRQGASESLVADAAARACGVPATALRRAWMLTGDLGTAVTIARTEGEAGLARQGLVVGVAVRPMLASTATSPADAMTSINGPASVEWKLDGARIQVHRSGRDVAIFTRNLNDVTARLADLVARMLRLPCQRFVLDGEVIGLAEENDRPRAFQDTIGDFSRDDQHNRADRSLLAPYFFDCLHLDGESLIDEPLEKRLTALQEAVPAHRIHAVSTTDIQQAEAVLASSLASGHEGIMVKALDSPYAAGRRGSQWLKVKPVRTFDLVVLAAEWGHGRRQGWLSNLHLGARTADGSFVMVGKTFKGLTDNLLAWQTQELLARRTSERSGTVFVAPDLVVEIALDGVQTSTRYPGGVALRFARVRRYRSDKSPAEADLLTDLQMLVVR